MDNTLLYYSPAEIEYRRQRAARSISTSRRRKARAAWLRRHSTGTTA